MFFKYKVVRIDEEENQIMIFLDAQEEGCQPKVAVSATPEEFESNPMKVGDEVELDFSKKK